MVADYSTFVQMSYCVKAYGWQLSDLRADALLRSGRKTGVIRPSCSWCTALEPLVGNYQTFVQIAYCVRVYGCRLFDLRARYALSASAGRRARLERHTTQNPPNARKITHVWSATQPKTLQTRDKLPAFGALNQPQPSKHEKNSTHLERQTRHNTPNARKVARVWSCINHTSTRLSR